MKRILTFLFFLAATTCAFSQADTWAPITSLPATARGAAFAFSIGEKGYVGGGLNFTSGILHDFFEYDPATDAWTQKADVGGGGRVGAVGFSIAGKGYVLTGSDDLSVKQNDIWEYDPVTNAWTNKTDLPATARSYAVGFSIGNKGYIGTGAIGFAFDALHDFWQYDPVTDVWTQKANVPLPGRSSATAFSIDGKGYIGTGDTCNMTTCFSLNDFYEYDTLTNVWTAKAPLPALRDQAVGFSMSGKGYICTGSVDFSATTDLLEYDPVADTWTPKASFPGSARTDGVAFAIGNKAYVGTGYDATFTTQSDFFVYTGELIDTTVIDTTVIDTTVDTDSTVINYILNHSIGASHALLFPDPVIDLATITITVVLPGNTELEIYSTEGKKIPGSYINLQEKSSHKAVWQFRKNNLTPGIYYYRIRSGDTILSSGKFTLAG